MHANFSQARRSREAAQGQFARFVLLHGAAIKRAPRQQAPLLEGRAIFRQRQHDGCQRQIAVHVRG